MKTFGLSVFPALLLGATALIPTSASADIVTETFTGTVTGVDAVGYFGTAGASLNTSFTTTYVINTNLADANQYNFGGEIGTYGGTAYSVPSPVTNASMEGMGPDCLKKTKGLPPAQQIDLSRFVL
jgi:hypothetical protein